MTAPMPYDLTDPKELQRLYRELLGYMKISVHDGTDRKGREYALRALEELCSLDELFEKSKLDVVIIEDQK